MEEQNKTPAYPCVLLAAGAGLRMKGGAKLLLPLGGETVLARAARAAIEHCDPLVVVTGKDGDLVRESLKRSGLFREKLIFAHNPRWMEGRVGSLRAGVAALGNNQEGFFLAHADMPFVDPGVYKALAEAAAARKTAQLPPALLFPSIKGKKGHPVFFPFSFLPFLLAVREAESLKETVSKLEQAWVETACDGILEDIDKPEDYERLLRKYGLAEGPSPKGTA